MKINHIYNIDCLEGLKELPDESINCCVTSPPYWALRDYGVKGQLGLETTFEEYISKLCDIFDEVKRVLRKDGTCWVNIGDTYYTKSGGKFENDNLSKKNAKEVSETTGINKANELRGKPHKYMQSKSLCLIPQRFQIEMVKRGWICRNTIIWHKPNCMPSSASDRFTVDFEYLFFFVKSKKYYFKQQFEKSKDPADDIRRILKSKNYNMERQGGNSAFNCEKRNENKTKERMMMGRNKRTVWTISTRPYKEAHFAVYPKELIETPIDAGCPLKVCSQCGNPYVTIRIPKNIEEDDGKEILDFTETKTPYSVQERDGYILTRILPHKGAVSNYLQMNRQEKGMTIEKIESIFGTQAPHHWFNGESYPSVDDWVKLKEILVFDDKFDDAMTTQYKKHAKKCMTEYEMMSMPTCKCNADITQGIVLDPFMGSGTTAQVALEQGKKFIGFELNPDYIEIINKRIAPYMNQERLT